MGQGNARSCRRCRRQLRIRAPNGSRMNEHGVELLLIEDNPCDVELILHVLKKHNLAQRVKVLWDGAEALDFLFGNGRLTRTSARALRLIVLDLKLPKVSGAEVLEKLKRDPQTSTIPVVVLTSSREDQDLRSCYELGANSYLVKPVEFEQFAETVRQLGLYWLLLNQRSRSAPKTLEV